MPSFSKFRDRPVEKTINSLLETNKFAGFKRTEFSIFLSLLRNSFVKLEKKIAYDYSDKWNNHLHRLDHPRNKLYHRVLGTHVYKLISGHIR